MLSLTINGVDFTAKWRLYESSWTMRAWQGEGAQSSFILDDIDGTIDHADISAKKVVEVWDDATGSPKCMYRGRVANKTLGMAPQQAPGVAMRWTVLTEDYNVDLKGIEVQGFDRGEETDDERVEAVRLEFLNGGASISPRARTTTNLDGNFIGSDPLDAAPLFDETYTDTDPLGVLTRIVEMTGRVFFVYLTDAGDGELVYFNRASDSSDLLSDIEIRDDGQTEGVDDISIFAPYKGPQAGDHGGQNILTGGSVRYMGGGFYRDSDVDGREATYDKWESTIRNDNIRREEAAQDFLEANVDASEETFTYLATIDMRAEYAHLIRAGMRVRIKRQRANQTTSQQLLVVTSEHKPIKPDADGEAIYQVNLEIGRPLNPHFTRSRFNIPLPPTQPTPESCTRMYFSSTASSITTDPTLDGDWVTDSSGGASIKTLKMTADGSLVSTHQNTSSATGAAGGRNIMYMRAAIEMDAALTAVIAAGGAEIRMQARSRARFGVGISESSQDMISQLGVRVTTGDSTTIRGTALSLHSQASSTGGNKWVAQSTKVNRKYPAATANDTLASVSGAAAGDYLIVEVGSRNFTTVTSGGAICLMNDGTEDLPEDDFTTNDALNAWVEICTEAGGGGSQTEPTTGGDTGSPGTSTVWAPIDHVHPHGRLADDGTHLHDLPQIQAHSELVHAERVNAPPTVTDDEDADWDEGDIWVDMSTGEAWVLVDATAGAAVWEQIAPSGGGSFAPSTADYLVGTAQGGLSAEIVVGTTPGGEPGGTWASPTVDAVHSGSSHASITTSFVTIAKWGTD